MDTPTSAPHKITQKNLVLIPFSLLLIVIGVFIIFGLAAPLLADGGIHFLNLVFWLIPIPFLILPIIRPKWIVACVTALIFWMPGTIDHFWDVRVSFHETADKLRVLSLLDWVFLLALLLPSQKRLKLRQIDALTLGFLILLAGLTLFNIFSHTFTLDIGRIPALLTGLIFLRLLLVFWVITKFVHKGEDIHRIYLGLLVGAMGLIANTSVMYLLGASIGGRLVAGTFGNNIFGVLLSVMITFAGGYKGVTKKPLLKAGLTSLQLICLFLLILSGTRIAIVLLIVGWGILFFLRHKNPVRFLSQGFIFIVVLALSVALLARFASSLNLGTDRVASLINIATGQASRAEYEYTFRTWHVRTIIWNFAWERLATNPWLGIGPGQWNYERTFSSNPYVYAPNGVYDSISDPHNGYIHIALEYGLPTLFIYELFLMVCLWKGWHSLRKLKRLSEQKEDHQLTQLFVLFGGIFSAIIILLLGEITNSYITKLHLQLFFGVLMFTLLKTDKIINNTFPSRAASLIP